MSGNTIKNSSYAAYLAEHNLPIPDGVIPEGYMLVKVLDYVKMRHGECLTCDERRRKKTATQARWRAKKRK
ncbi:MAG: hypothetical protein HN738_10205 [Gammaproteobacteria bacterium]|jgi:hypothetical protein|nr:hypothetical protein [Gammaproteobacteria bacterium]